MAGEREWAAPVKASAGRGCVERRGAGAGLVGGGGRRRCRAGGRGQRRRDGGGGAGGGSRRGRGRADEAGAGPAGPSTRKKRMEEKEKIEGMTSGPIDDCFNGVKINHNLFLCNPLTKQKIGSDPTLSTKH